jgi:hypothetical protein
MAMGSEKDSSMAAWIPLVEFSVKKGISLSTLRRYIKANKIKFKLVEGRYLVLDDGQELPARTPPDSSEKNDFDGRLKHLEKNLQAANEEIAELKTLIAFYEEKWVLTQKK